MAGLRQGIQSRATRAGAEQRLSKMSRGDIHTVLTMRGEIGWSPLGSRRSSAIEPDRSSASLIAAIAKQPRALSPGSSLSRGVLVSGSRHGQFALILPEEFGWHAARRLSFQPSRIDDYQWTLMFCLCYPVMGGGLGDVANERGMALARAMTDRCVAAIRDWKAFEFLKD